MDKKIDSKEILNCEDCGSEKKDVREYTIVDGSIITVCSSCLDDDYFTCPDCGMKEYNEDGYSIYNSDSVCRNCVDDYYFCESCDRNYTVYDFNSRAGCCNSCAEDMDEPLERNVDVATNDYIDDSDSKINTKRIFSCEIECQYPDEDALHDIADNFSSSLGISGDGSINGNGVEYQTPRLSGNKGIEYIEKLCEMLEKNKFTVDRSCGLHIHLDGGKTLQKDLAKLKILMAFYLYFEDVILSFLPYSRRENNYCLPLSRNYNVNDILKCKTVDALEKIWYKESSKTRIAQKKKDKYEQTRYSGVNFHSLLANNHIEIRFHSGTLSASKIIYWIMFNCTIIDMIENGKITLKDFSKTKLYRDLRTKAIDMFELLGLFKVSDSLWHDNPTFPVSCVMYFLKRQDKFALHNIKSNNTEETLCVE